MAEHMSPMCHAPSLNFNWSKRKKHKRNIKVKIKPPETVESPFYFPFFTAAASGSFPEVYGMGGDPVTLPCFYPESRVLSFVCWGRGECASDTCGQTLVWTDGNRVHYRTSSRYQINAQLLQGNASLTIEDAYESDSGLFCCRVEMKGWDGVQTLTTSLQVRPGKHAFFLSLFLASEPSPLLANNLFFSCNKETMVLINMLMSKHLLSIIFSDIISVCWAVLWWPCPPGYPDSNFLVLRIHESPITPILKCSLQAQIPLMCLDEAKIIPNVGPWAKSASVS